MALQRTDQAQHATGKPGNRVAPLSPSSPAVLGEAKSEHPALRAKVHEDSVPLKMRKRKHETAVGQIVFGTADHEDQTDEGEDHETGIDLPAFSAVSSTGRNTRFNDDRSYGGFGPHPFSRRRFPGKTLSGL